MPCKDITDILKIRLDHDNRVVKYSLHKKTCGGEVGRKALIGKWLKNRPAQEILDSTVEKVLAAHSKKTGKWEFLVVKHFLAVQSGLAILLGKRSGGVKDYCTIESVEHSPGGVLLVAEISVDGLTEEIKACGVCCGVK